MAAQQKPIKYVSRLTLLTSWLENKLGGVEQGEGSQKTYAGWSPQNIRAIISYISDAPETSGVILIRHLALDNSPKVIKLAYSELLSAYKKNNKETASKYDYRVDEEVPGATEAKTGPNGQPIAPALCSIFNVCALRFEAVTNMPKNTIKSAEDLFANSTEIGVEVGPGRYIRAYKNGRDREYKGLEEFVVISDGCVKSKRWLEADKQYVKLMQATSAVIKSKVLEYNKNNTENKKDPALLAWNRLYGAGYFELICPTSKVQYRLQNSSMYGNRWDMFIAMCNESAADRVSYAHFCDLLVNKNTPLRYHRQSSEMIPVVFGGEGHESIQKLFDKSWYKYVPGTLTPKHYVQDALDGVDGNVLYERFKAIEAYYMKANASNEAQEAVIALRKKLCDDITKGFFNLEYPVRYWPVWLEMLTMTHFNIEMLAGNMAQLEILRGYSAETAYTQIPDTKLMGLMRDIIQVKKTDTMPRAYDLFNETAGISANKATETGFGIDKAYRPVLRNTSYLAVGVDKAAEVYAPDNESLTRAMQYMYNALVSVEVGTDRKLVGGADTHELTQMLEQYITTLYFIIAKGKVRNVKYMYVMIDDNIDKSAGDNTADNSRVQAYNLFKLSGMDKIRTFTNIMSVKDIAGRLANGALPQDIVNIMMNSFGCIGAVTDKSTFITNLYEGTLTNTVGLDADRLIAAYKRNYYNDKEYNKLQEVIGSPWSNIKTQDDVIKAKADIQFLSAYIDSRILRQYAIAMIEWLNYMDIMYSDDGKVRLDIITGDMFSKIIEQVAEGGYPDVILCKRVILKELRDMGVFSEDFGGDSRRAAISEEIDRIWDKINRVLPITSSRYFVCPMRRVEKLSEFDVTDNPANGTGGIKCFDVRGLLYTDGFLLSNLVTHGLRTSNLRSSVYRRM